MTEQHACHRHNHLTLCILPTDKTEDDKVEDYTMYLKSLYKTQLSASSDHDQWPPPVTNKVFRLSMIEGEQVRRGDTEDSVRETTSGKVDDFLQKKVAVDIKDIFSKTEDPRKVVLMEGAPGCGKSTLLLDICHRWAIGTLFQNYKQVILVKLREPSVQKANRIVDILPQRNEKMAQNIADKLIDSDGSDVLFIFDGWDELPHSAPGYSLIFDLIKGTQLHMSSVIITSRPISSAKLHRIISVRIEILGFTQDELRQYFAGCLENDAQSKEVLQERIRENPAVAGSCYLPLNASILVHLVKCLGKTLPKNQYGIFSALICNCILRHLKKKKERPIPYLKSLDKLPQAVDVPFQDLCKVAYKGVMEDKISFDLEYGFNTLGLLQGVESFAVCGMSHSYNFLHLSIQELLAAFYIATQLEPSEQIARFRELFSHARFSTVFQFYAAKTKLQTPGIRDFVIQVVERCAVETPKSDDKAQLLSLLHCLYEAQDSSLCQLVADHLKSRLNLEDTSLNSADCLSIGFFLKETKRFNVNLRQCSISDEECRFLFKEGTTYDIHTLR